MFEETVQSYSYHNSGDGYGEKMPSEDRIIPSMDLDICIIEKTANIGDIHSYAMNNRDENNNLILIAGLRPSENGRTIYMAYDISGNYYDPQRLTREGSPPENILYRIPIDVSKLTSDPGIINSLDNGVIVMTDNTNLAALNSSSPTAQFEPMVYNVMFRVPNMILYRERTNLPDQLEKMNLPIFDRYIWDQINDYVDDEMPLNTLILDLSMAGRTTIIPFQNL